MKEIDKKRGVLQAHLESIFKNLESKKAVGIILLLEDGEEKVYIQSGSVGMGEVDSSTLIEIQKKMLDSVLNDKGAFKK